MPSSYFEPLDSRIFKFRVPYASFSIKDILIEGKKGPNGLKVVEKIFDNVVVLGEYNQKKKQFEGLVKIDDGKSNIECLVNIKNLKKNGKGVFKFPNGDFFDGVFENDEMKGSGEYYFTQTASMISGDVFKGDKVEGVGKFTWENKIKATFVGQILNGIPHGKGKL